jgi:hypothetical protein
MKLILRFDKDICAGFWILFSGFWIIPCFEDIGNGGINIFLSKVTCGEEILLLDNILYLCVKGVWY